MSQFHKIAEDALRANYRRLDLREEELKRELETVRAAKEAIAHTIFKPKASPTAEPTNGIQKPV